MNYPRRGSTAYKMMMEEQALEALKPKSNTNWSSPRINLISGMNCLRGALASGENARLEKRWNHECAYPIRINPDVPWSQQVSKKYRHKVWVVVLYYNHMKYKTPVLVNILNVLAYPLKFIPKKSVMHMDEYTNYNFRVGSVVHGYEVEFKIPKKFSFKN